MRGAPPILLDGQVSRRIIPADAGSTYLDPEDDTKVEDHPRGCGEHALADLPAEFRLGSSPRMRGARSVDYFINSANRIIPADAGSTPSPADWLGFSIGSSPRMRGAPPTTAFGKMVNGIIPADAGSTWRG